ncbi:hypothetical protein [Pseudomarimonas arenosa]|uniref:Thioredoxin domain-containing protein n=1 Tax=Pseudomarimonas arenosa TaxID=2774145 RepID=A0AAW3ZS14_9GAMM|nr:hypothetical protein [Pseudomarimonas arenosa]MBD8527892.1 hypothetical protein [Pseudomarimonas arenosa]
MDGLARWRVWFWILVIPVVVSSCLSMHLRNAAISAQVEQWDEQSKADASERKQSRDERLRQKRTEQAALQLTRAERCGKAARSMLPAPPSGPLLVIVTERACPNYGCNLLREAERQVSEYNLHGLSGVWVLSSAASAQLAQANARPESRGLRTVVADTCQDLFEDSQFSEDFVLLDRDGGLLHAGAMHLRHLPDSKPRAISSEPTERLRKALKDHL